MHAALQHFVADIALLAPSNERVRFAFCCECAERIRPLLGDDPIVDCLDTLAAYVAGGADARQLERAAWRAAELASAPVARAAAPAPGADAAAHAIAAARHAVAQALVGQPVATADYAAYAAVLGHGGYAALAGRDAFAAEFAWQRATLATLAERHGLGPA